MVAAAPPIQEKVPIKDLQKVFHYTDTLSRKPTRDNDLRSLRKCRFNIYINCNVLIIRTFQARLEQTMINWQT